MKSLAPMFVAAVLAAVSAAPTHAATISLTNSTPGLFDASSGTRSVTVTGAEPAYGDGTVDNVRVTINFAKADGESFDPPYPSGTPFYNEIVFRLTSPLGTTVDLIAAGSFNVGTGGFDGTIVFDDSAASVVNVNPNVVQAGTFQPVGSLASFTGQLAQGDWTLFIQDTVGADALRFRSFTLDLDTASVPEPLTMLLLGTGLVGTLARRARRRA